MGSTTTHLGRATSPPRVRAVSRPTSVAERQADAAADVVAAGGSVADWTFHRTPATTLHRDHHDTGGPPTQPDLDPSDEAEEARDAVLEALPQTPAGQRLIQAVRDDPGVRAIEQALTSDPALVTYGVLGAGAIGAGIAATVARGGAARDPDDEFELPLQMPLVPLDSILPGLSARVAWEGPVDAPTNAGLVLRWEEPAADDDPSSRDRVAAETRALVAQQQYWDEALRTPEDRRREQEVVARWIASRTQAPDLPTLVIPFGEAAPRVVPPARLQLEPPSLLRRDEGPRMPSLLDDDQLHLGPMPTLPPVPRSALSTGDAQPTAIADVDAAVSGPGRPLPEPLRTSMDTAFGWDFSAIRLHDDRAASSAARALRARAFTVGDDVALDPDHVDPGTPAGRRTVAHELAHVVQAAAPRHRSEEAP